MYDQEMIPIRYPLRIPYDSGNKKLTKNPLSRKTRGIFLTCQKNIMEKEIKIELLKTPLINDSIYQAPTEDRLNDLAKDIYHNGLINPIRVSADYYIFDGNTRFKAYQILGYKTIKCIIHKDIFSYSEEFNRLLIAANNQRVKTDDDRLREIQITIDPAEYERRKEILNEEKIQLNKINGILKANRNISDTKTDLINTILDIIQDYADYLPLTVRSIHYILLDKNVLMNNKKANSIYRNDRSSYSALSNLLTKLRIQKIIDYDFIRDDGRKLYSNRGFDSANTYIKYEMNKILKTYFRDLQQSQKAYNIIFCEKETLRPILEKLTVKYGIPIAFIKGGSSLTIRYNFIRDWKAAGSKRKINALVLSDFDPAGYRIKDSLIGSLKNDFMDDLKGVELNGYHIGITKEQIKKYSLHSDLDAKESDKNFIEFCKITGTNKAYELDALKPEQLINEVEAAIKNSIDIEKYNQEMEQYNEDINKIETTRTKLISSLTGFKN